MKPAAFDYFAPRSVEEATTLLAEHGGDGRVLAGGQSLVPAMNFRLARPAVLIDINNIAGLAGVRAGGRHARHRRAHPPRRLREAGDRRAAGETSPDRRPQHRASAHPYPRHVRRLHRPCRPGGGVVRAGAGARRGDRRAKRGREPDDRRPRDWFKSIFTTDIRDGEMVTEVRLPRLGDDWRCGFVEFNRRAGDFAIVSAVAALRIDGGVIREARLALGGVVDKPVRATEAETAAGRRQPPGDAVFRAAADAARAGLRAVRRYPRRRRVQVGAGRGDGAARAGTGGRRMTWVGRSLPRSEDRALLSGHGWFTADAAAGARAVVFVRSPVARGRIVGIERPEGATVITAADLAGVAGIRPLLHRPDYVPVTQPILAEDTVTFAGQPVAAVIAATREEAEDIAEQVFVDIDAGGRASSISIRRSHPARRWSMPTPPAMSWSRARSRPRASPRRSPTRRRWSRSTSRSRRQNAMPLEARGGLAAFDRRTGRVTLTCSTQMPHMLRTGIADCLGMPERELRVIAPDVGGGFGQKMSLIPEYVFLVWAARRFGGSLAWIEDRRENLTASFHSRDQRHIVRGAFAADGRLLAVEADIRCNVGAYSCYPVTCGVEPLMAMAEFPGPYDVREYKVRSRGVTTNTCPMAPYRGVSRPAITLSMERLMDCAAARLGIDPVEIRRRNLVTAFPYKTVTGLTYDEGSYRQSLDLAEETVGIAAFRERQRAARAEGRYLGVGFSVFNERSGYGTPAFAARSMDITPGYERVEIAMDPSGHVELRIGASPHGQGLQQALRQLIADIARHRARDGPRHPRRYRRHALRLGHLRQPLDGDLRRRLQARRREARGASSA